MQTKRDMQILNEIEQWEQIYFGDDENSLFLNSEKRMAQTLDAFKPDIQKKAVEAIENIIFHLQAFIQNSSYDKKLEDGILGHARVFEPNIETIEDMQRLSIDQLRFIVNKELSKQRLLSLTQGGVTGIGSFMFLALDLPLILTINLRTIQSVAMSYGYDLRKPSEMSLALQLFHVATLPKAYQKEGWDLLNVELEEIKNGWLIGEEQATLSTIWLQQPLKQLAKGFVIFLLRNKLFQGVPILGMAIGAAANYRLTKQVSEIAHSFYQKRFLIEKTSH